VGNITCFRDSMLVLLHVFHSHETVATTAVYPPMDLAALCKAEPSDAYPRLSTIRHACMALSHCTSADTACSPFVLQPTASDAAKVARLGTALTGVLADADDPVLVEAACRTMGRLVKVCQLHVWSYAHLSQLPCVWCSCQLLHNPTCGQQELVVHQQWGGWSRYIDFQALP
jgi:hypothetical protein